jgi:hypothetical protein
MSEVTERSSLDEESQRRMDAVVVRLTPTRRTFTEEEAFSDQWQDGHELAPALDPRFVPAAKAGRNRLPHWRLITHNLANNRLLDALITSEWDGTDVDAELARLDIQEGGHQVFCPVDPRFVQTADGRWEPSDGERDVPLTAETRAALDALGPQLLERWQEQGQEPWTLRRIESLQGDLGWVEANSRGSWQRLRTWLKGWDQVARVGRDYWVPADSIPQSVRKTRLQVLPVCSSDEAVNIGPIPSGEACPENALPVPDLLSAGRPVLIPSEDGTAGVEVRWATTLRTVYLLEGFIPVPSHVRSAYPPRVPGTGRWETLRGKWFDTDEDLWLWLDRDEDRLFGPDLADKLAWCEAGERLRIHWASDVTVIRSVGVDAGVQEEERRLVDVEALAELRGGLAESYRRSLLAILAEAPQGLTFRELVQAIRERQGHEVHRGTVRAILSAGGFVKRKERWFPPSDPRESGRSLRRAVVQRLLPAEADTDKVPDTPQRLKELARVIANRLREIIASWPPKPTEDRTPESHE